MVDLKAKREAAEMTQEQLGNKVNVGRTTISNIECGIRLPSVETAQAIAVVLGFKWTDFFE